MRPNPSAAGPFPSPPPCCCLRRPRETAQVTDEGSGGALIAPLARGGSWNRVGGLWWCGGADSAASNTRNRVLLLGCVNGWKAERAGCCMGVATSVPHTRFGGWRFPLRLAHPTPLVLIFGGFWQLHLMSGWVVEVVSISGEIPGWWCQPRRW
jgi:hypothetical protein